MSNLILKGIVSILEKAALAAGFYPDAIKFARAYALSEGKAPEFSPETFRQCHEALVRELRASVRAQGTWRHICPTVGGSWHTSAAGVVGQYEVSGELTEGGIRFRCWDTWDFNLMNKENFFVVPIPADALPAIKQAEKLFPALRVVNIFEGENYPPEWMLHVDENLLSKMNKGRAFRTEWGDFVSWEELNCDPARWRLGKEGTIACYKKK